MMQLTFIRHAETDWNVTGRWQGHADMPLNEAGKAQAERLARRLAHWPLDVVLSSDLKRAYETARPVAEQSGVSLLIRPEWRERDVGLLSGLTSPEIRTRWPDKTKKYGFDPPEGEKLSDFHQRVETALVKLVQNGNGWKNIAVVTHGGVIHALLANVWNYSPYDRLPLTNHANTSITTFHVDDGLIRPGTINDHAHLEPLCD